MAYLTQSEYVARFGAAETVRITDESQTGAIGTDKMADALDDASAEADSYLGTRYTLPIADPPEILKRIVADITRAMLFKDRATPQVLDNAERARSQLKDLARGLAVLPVASGDEAPIVNPSGNAVTSHDARPRIFDRCRMADFTDLSGGGRRDPCGIPGTGPC